MLNNHGGNPLGRWSTTMAFHGFSHRGDILGWQFSATWGVAKTPAIACTSPSILSHIAALCMERTPFGEVYGGKLQGNRTPYVRGVCCKCFCRSSHVYKTILFSRLTPASFRLFFHGNSPWKIAWYLCYIHLRWLVLYTTWNSGNRQTQLIRLNLHFIDAWFHSSIFVANDSNCVSPLCCLV